MAGIAANETGYGKYVGGNNLFGIKGANPNTGASFNSPTWESVNGQRVDINDTFRAYNNPGESFADFANFLQTNSRYSGALQGLSAGGSPEQFIRAIQQAGYATDPNWANQVLAIAKTAQRTEMPGGKVSTFYDKPISGTAGTGGWMTPEQIAAMKRVLGETNPAIVAYEAAMRKAGVSTDVAGAKIQTVAETSLPATGQAFQGLTTTVNAEGQTISVTYPQLMQLTSDRAQAAFTALNNGVTLEANALTVGVVTEGQQLSDGYVAMMEATKNKAQEQFDLMAASAGTLNEGIGSVANSADAAKPTIDDLSSSAGDASENWDDFADSVDGATKELKAYEKQMSSAIKAQQKAAGVKQSGKIKDLPVISVPGIGSDFNIPVGFAASGGPINGFTIVGEQGPELVWGKGSVTSTRETAALLSGRGSGGIYIGSIVVNGAEKSPSEIAREVRDELLRLSRRNGSTGL
jgi:hypothetical protein